MTTIDSKPSIAAIYADLTAAHSEYGAHANANRDGDAPEVQATNARANAALDALADSAPRTQTDIAILARAALDVAADVDVKTDRSDRLSRLLCAIWRGATGEAGDPPISELDREPPMARSTTAALRFGGAPSDHPSSCQRKASMDLRVVAIHEAGHALAVERLGLKIKAVTIVPKGNVGGTVHHNDTLRRLKRTGDDSDRERLKAERVIMLCLAGPEAQKRFDPNSDWEACGESDFHVAAELTWHFLGEGDSATAFMEWMKIRTRELVDQNWSLIEYLAEQLVERKTIDGETAMQLIKHRRMEELGLSHLLPRENIDASAT